MRDNFKSKTINIVSRRAGFRCSNPNCRKLTVGANNDKDKSTLLGVAAHISAASPRRPRYNISISSEERSNIKNAIWLCVNCSTLIDKDSTKYSEQILNEWKIKIEEESAFELENNHVKSKNDISEDSFKRKPLLERIRETKDLKVKQIENENYLQSNQAILDAREEAYKTIERLKEWRSKLEDPKNGFYLGFNSPINEVYEFGYKNYYLNFTWSNPQENDINKAPLKVAFYIKQGTYPFDYKEFPKRKIDYKFSRKLRDKKVGFIMGIAPISKHPKIL